MWDLATRDNWELILADNRSVKYERNTRPDKVPYYYEPIAPIYATPHSHILLIGTKSLTAKAHWYLGARASQYLYVSPSMTSNLISGVQTSDIKKVGLNRLTLVKFENYDISPYTLQLEIPYWLEDIYVEVWEYTGTYSPETTDERLAAIEQDLERIEVKLDALENYGN